MNSSNCMLIVGNKNDMISKSTFALRWHQWWCLSTSFGWKSRGLAVPFSRTYLCWKGADSHFRTWPRQMTLIRAIKPKGDQIASVQSVSFTDSNVSVVIKTKSKILIWLSLGTCRKKNQVEKSHKSSFFQEGLSSLCCGLSLCWEVGSHLLCGGQQQVSTS